MALPSDVEDYTIDTARDFLYTSLKACERYSKVLQTLVDDLNTKSNSDEWLEVVSDECLKGTTFHESQLSRWQEFSSGMTAYIDAVRSEADALALDGEDVQVLVSCNMDTSLTHVVQSSLCKRLMRRYSPCRACDRRVCSQHRATAGQPEAQEREQVRAPGAGEVQARQAGQVRTTPHPQAPAPASTWCTSLAVVSAV
jgi:hypothetical protein